MLGNLKDMALVDMGTEIDRYYLFKIYLQLGMVKRCYIYSVLTRFDGDHSFAAGKTNHWIPSVTTLMS